MEVLTRGSAVAAILVGTTLGQATSASAVFPRPHRDRPFPAPPLRGTRACGPRASGPLVGAAFATTTTAAPVPCRVIGGAERKPARVFGGLPRARDGAQCRARAGVSSLRGSRGTSIGILLGWQLIAIPLLVRFGASALSVRGLVDAVTHRLTPAALVDGSVAVPMSLGATVGVLFRLDRLARRRCLEDLRSRCLSTCTRPDDLAARGWQNRRGVP